MIYRYHAIVSAGSGRLFDVWLSARSQAALEEAIAEVIDYMTQEAA